MDKVYIYMQQRFQYFLTLSLLFILFSCVGLYAFWIRNQMYDRALKQGLESNEMVAIAIIKTFENIVDSETDFDVSYEIITNTCRELKVANNGSLYLLKSQGDLVAGIESIKHSKISQKQVYFETIDKKKYSFDEFLKKEHFSGFIKYKDSDLVDIVSSYTSRSTKYKLLVNQDALAIKKSANEKAQYLFWIGIGFSFIISLFIFLLIRYMVNGYKKKIEKKNIKLLGTNYFLEKTNNSLKNKNEELFDLNLEKDALMSIMAHDLKNPLGSIQSLTDMVDLSGDLNDEQRTYFNILKDQAKAGQDLISDILSMKSIEAEGEIEIADFIDIISFMKESIFSFKVLADEKDIKFDFYSNMDEFTMRSQTRLLKQVVGNLFSNAIKFSPNNSIVDVKVQKIDSFLQISIKNLGIGIKESELPLLFKKFSKLSTRPTAEENSTGLGLYIVKILIKRLFGEVSVQSEYGKNATFTLLFPLKKVQK